MKMKNMRCIYLAVRTAADCKLLVWMPLALTAVGVFNDGQYLLNDEQGRLNSMITVDENGCYKVPEEWGMEVQSMLDFYQEENEIPIEVSIEYDVWYADWENILPGVWTWELL